MNDYNINILDEIIFKSDAYLLYNNNYDLSINLQNRLSQEKLTLVFNIQCTTISNYLDFYTAINNTVHSHIYNLENKRSYSFISNEDNNEYENDFLIFEYLIEFINRYTSKHDITPIFIFNDFEFLFNNDTDLLWKLRATMQSNKKIKYIATVKDEKSIKLNAKHPFYKYFRIVTSNKKMEYSLSKRLAIIGIQIKDLEIEILNKYLNNDFMKLELFTTLLKAQLDDYKLKNYNIAYYDMDLIYQTLEKMHILSISLYKELTTKLQSVKHGLFIYKHNYLNKNIKYEYDLCKRYNRSSINDFKEENYYRIIRKLEKKGFLVKSKNTYVHTDSMFLAFLFGRTSKDAIRQELENYEKWISNE